MALPRSRARSRRLRLLALALTGSLALTGLAACGGPDERDIAEQFAAGLAAGDLTEVPVVSGTSAQADDHLHEVTAGMADLRPEVRVARVSSPVTDEDGNTTATATLEHTWAVPAGAERTGSWAYTTTVDLADTEDGWAVRWAPSAVADIADGELLSLSRTQPPRASVLGAGAVTLVTNRPITRLGLDKGQLAPEQVEASARALATLAELDPDPLANRAVKAGPRQFVTAITYRAEQVPQSVRDGIGQVPGAVLINGEQALAPTREFARPILGSVGEVTAELIQQDPKVYRAGDTVGLSGLQQRYEAQLGGTPGAAVLANRPGGQGRTLFQLNAEPGTPLATTLDPTLQTAAEQLLASTTPASAIVIVRASTGEVVAAASGPGSDGYSTSTMGRYAPGSTFKVVTALALLRAGLTPDSPVECPATITVDGRTFSNYSDFPADRVGTMTLQDALATSCNTAFIGAAQQQNISPADLALAAGSLGIGWSPDASGAEVYPGSVPTEGSATEVAAARIGQGKVVTSPLAMATVTASVLHGATVVPRLVSDPAPPAADAPAQPLTAEEAAALRSMMRAVVTSGTASVVAGAGDGVIAKTGTAEYGEATPPATRAWLIAGRGDYAVAVFVAEGASGSQTAGPLMAQLLPQLPA